MPIKSFRGLIADDTQDTIHLSTRNGSVGYKITKFQIFAHKPGDNTGANFESVVKIYKIDQQGTVNGTVDFNDNTLLAAAFLPGKTSEFTQDDIVVFDNEIFNQDIYVTHSDVGGNSPINYYIELEQFKLDLNENTVATLKDIRNIEASNV
jgi:hypothetical protein